MTYKVGDKVRIKESLTYEDFASNVGWGSGMKDCIGKEGTVTYVFKERRNLEQVYDVDVPGIQRYTYLERHLESPSKIKFQFINEV